MAMAPASKPRRSFGRGFLIFLVGIGLVVALSTVFGQLFSDGLEGSGEKIALVEVSGMIADSTDIVRQLSQYRRDPDVKGIILRIDSPGGAVAPSQEIHDEVWRVRADNKMVFTSMGSLAASGGYYIAAATNRIFANPGSLTGSIGVIMAFSNAQELIQKIGLKPEVVKSGKFKDTGSPARKMKPEERKYLQRVVDDVHKQFIEAVAKGRSMKTQEARKLADGRIFTGRQALKLKMVDELGGLEDVIRKMGEELGIPGRPHIVQEVPKAGLLDWFLGDTKSLTRDIKTAIWPARFPSLQYLWLPG